LYEGLDESPTVTVGEDNKTNKVQYGYIQVTTLTRQQEATKWHMKACGVKERKVKILGYNKNCAWIYNQPWCPLPINKLPTLLYIQV
jgi:hypothetical protein